ncbi:MAG: hypothetical protein HY716_13280 [Planctomycetes bacterium]|nr:hypothetical protein [Planctomycetota bacterium]
MATSLKWVVGTAFVSIGAGAAWAQDAPWGLPPGCSTIAPEVDWLYNFIFVITGLVFVGVEALLLYFCVKYRRRPGGKPGYSHGSKLAEAIWTVSPALVLLFIALVQLPTWAKAKIDFPDPTTDKDVVVVQVLAERFKWSFRYPGRDDKFFGPAQDIRKADDAAELDDVILRDFKLPLGAKAVMPIRSIDVIHSFSIFNMRVKQDAVPGLRNRVWFQPTGFYVAPVARSSLWVNPEQKFEPTSKPAWNDWEFIDSMQKYAEKYGSKSVAVETSPSIGFSGGAFRPMSQQAVVTVYRNDEILEKRPVAEAEYVIVPYQVACMELCGQGHYTMVSSLTVLPPKVYQHWYEARMKEREEFALQDDLLNVWKLWRD